MASTFRNVTLLGLIAAGAVTACVNKSDSSSSAQADAVSPPDVKLATFDYEVDTTMLKSLGKRIGCGDAARYVRFPRDGSLKNAIKAVMTSGRAYRSFQSEIADTATAAAACGDMPREADKNAGIKHLLEVARKVSPCAAQGCAGGLTFIMLGGLGGQFDGDGPWAENRAAWKALATTDAVPHRRRADGSIDSSLRVWRLDAERSYQPDSDNIASLQQKLAALEAAEPSSYAHQYFFVGYSKGGPTGIHMLGSSKELREKTLALMPLNAPLAGSVVFDVAGEQLKSPVLAHANLANVIEPAVLAQLQNLPLAYLLGGATKKEDLQYVATFSGDFIRGVTSLSVPERKKYLYEWMPAHDFTRSSGKAIPVLQVAGLIDLVDLRPLPHVTYKDGKVAMKEAPNTLDDFKQTIFAPTFSKFPLSDTIVSLEHSAIPRNAFVNGLAPTLHAVLSLDHLRVRMRPRQGDPVPYLDIADALMDSAATSIEAQMSAPGAQGGTR